MKKKNIATFCPVLPLIPMKAPAVCISYFKVIKYKLLKNIQMFVN